MKDLCTAYVGNNIKMVHNKIDTLFTKKTNQLVPNLTNSQYLVLVYLAEQKNNAALQKDIEVKFELSHPTTVGIIKRLAFQDFVTTAPAQNNKRQTEVFLSQKGENLLSSINDGPRSILNAVDDQATKGFTEEEKQQLNSFLVRINENINNLDQNKKG